MTGSKASAQASDSITGTVRPGLQRRSQLHQVKAHPDRVMSPLGQGALYCPQTNPQEHRQGPPLQVPPQHQTPAPPPHRQGNLRLRETPIHRERVPHRPRNRTCGKKPKPPTHEAQSQPMARQCVSLRLRKQPAGSRPTANPAHHRLHPGPQQSQQQTGSGFEDDVVV